jgi:hypothetical protein
MGYIEASFVRNATMVMEIECYLSFGKKIRKEKTKVFFEQVWLTQIERFIKSIISY